MSKLQTEPTVDIEILKADLAKIKDDLASLAGSLVDRGRQSARAVRQTIEDKVGSSVDALESFVEERPLTTVMLAFGAGIVTAMLLRRR
jgi:ElaB/YqjD/DUF883 family membrane-anchored ribosome-binding protein